MEDPVSPKRWAQRVLGFLILLLTMLPGALQAEYYEYVDERGVRIFTDDPSQVPGGTGKVHQGHLDHLNEAEKQQWIQRENKKVQQLNQKIKDRIKQQESREAADQQDKADLERQRRLAALRTPVAVTRGQVLVPVTLTYQNRSETVTMVLDTGASITAVNESVALALGITRGKKSAAVVAGGGILRTRLVLVDRISVGPRAMTGKKIMVLPEKGPEQGYQGLLGLDFLRNFSFSIDYANELIQWGE